jgi:protein-S-isoprenylcysteine O-methyltransferase Ste14
MAAFALALCSVGVLLSFGLRPLLQRRRTGDSGFRGSPGATGSWARRLLFGALLLGVLTPIAALTDLLPPVRHIDGLRWAGVVAAVVGILARTAAQLDMGESWRAGVDPAETTELITSGLFRQTRNPIYAFAALFYGGLAMMVPNLLAFAALACQLAGIELQVRLVEEPYLLAIHGETYQSYAARVGRFLPGIGRLPRPRTA